MTTVYVIIISDRHSDIGIEVWSDKDLAIDRARALAKSYNRFIADYCERDIRGYVFYACYSGEGDCVFVKEVEISETLTQRTS